MGQSDQQTQSFHWTERINFTDLHLYKIVKIINKIPLYCSIFWSYTFVLLCLLPWILVEYLSNYYPFKFLYLTPGLYFLWNYFGLLGLFGASGAFMSTLVKKEDIFPDSVTPLCFPETYAHWAKEISPGYGLSLLTLTSGNCGTFNARDRFLWASNSGQDSKLISYHWQCWAQELFPEPLCGPGAESGCLPLQICDTERWVLCFCNSVCRDRCESSERCLVFSVLGFQMLFAFIGLLGFFHSYILCCFQDLQLF